MSVWRDPAGRVRAPWVLGLFVLIAVVTQLLATLVLGIVGGGAVDLDSPRVLYFTGPTLLAGASATWITWKIFKEPTGLTEAHPSPCLAWGLLGGAAAVAVSCVVPALVGATSLSLTARPAGAVFGAGLLQLFTLAPAGVGEELLLRGLGLNALRRWLGDFTAVAISSVVFGALHLFNPGATWVAALLVALVGAWFGAVTVRTGSVWMAMGLHVGWNFFEGFVFGQPVSGNPPGTSLFIGEVKGPAAFWSGGDFGPEAAGWTAVVLVAALLATSVGWRSPPAATR